MRNGCCKHKPEYRLSWQPAVTSHACKHKKEQSADADSTGVFVLQSWCMMREISGLIYNATEEQVGRARNQLKASILFQQDGPGGLPIILSLLQL